MPCHSWRGLPHSSPCLLLRRHAMPPLPQTHQAPATTASRKDTQLIPTPRPSHRLFHPPGTLFSQLHSPLPHFGETDLTFRSQRKCPISQGSHSDHPLQNSLLIYLWLLLTLCYFLLCTFHCLNHLTYFFMSVSSQHTKPPYVYKIRSLPD